MTPVLATNWHFAPVTAAAARVAIVAGGPSLRGFDFLCLVRSGATVIAVNEAAGVLRFADFAFTIDSAILRTRMPFYCGRKVAAVPGDYLSPGARKRGWREPPVQPCDVHYLRRAEGHGLSRAPDTVHHGHHSGFGALGLARHLLANAQAAGANDLRLGLFGYDHKNLDRYWHGPGRDCDRPWSIDDLDYQRAAAHFDALGVQIQNGSPDSAIGAWLRNTPEGVAAWLS